MNTHEIENYMAGFDDVVQKRIKQVQQLITKTVKPIEAGFAYSMPAYKYKGKPLVYFAGYKNHIGLYALPNTHTQFSEQLKGYKQGKGSVQFPNNEPLPMALIEAMINFRKDEIDNL